MTRPAPNEDLDHLSDADFRMTVRAWIEANYPEDIRNPPKRLHWHQNRPWYIALAAKGWLCPGWPRLNGGMGLSPAKQLIMMEEQERHGCARISDFGIIMLGPLLIRYGSEAQRERFLPAILKGEHIWAQGYSEPNAGSDLASLKTRATRDGDDYIVNGQKTWTTLGMDANWIFMLVRTSSEGRKQSGISFLLVPMDSPGVTLRPIRNLDLHDEFCEVFFDNVRVSAENLVGDENAGWNMAKSLLGFERIFLGSPKQSEYALTRLDRLADKMGEREDPVFIDRYASLAMRLADLKALYERFADVLRLGGTLGADVSMLKIVQTELYQAITDEMLTFSGGHAGRISPIEGDSNLNPASMSIQSRPSSIYGGSNEIQRNILARTVLSLG
jgi:alkylation response protein AidB-like acyl-CoA dehydrogenase